MNRKAPRCFVILVAVLALATPLSILADDSAASIAAGGLVPRRETRIVMAKEVLCISPKKVLVDYDFRNDSDEDVTTEVAFPVPPYGYGPTDPAISLASFSDFRLFIDGKPTAFQMEAKATLKGKDVTGVLKAAKIDIPTFGHLREPSGTSAEYHSLDFERLPKSEQNRLVGLGLFEPDVSSQWADWDVHLQFHWTQRFPARGLVHIRHEYTPVEGFQMMQLESFKKVHVAGDGQVPKPLKAGRPQDDRDLLLSFCPDASFLRGAIHSVQQDDPEGGYFAYPHWVDFIVTTSNTWKRPIEDFTLIIERGRPDTSKRGWQTLISFCSPQNAKVEKLDADRFQVHLTNFVPTSELHIGFFDVPETKPAPKK